MTNWNYKNTDKKYLFGQLQKNNCINVTGERVSELIECGCE